MRKEIGKGPEPDLQDPNQVLVTGNDEDSAYNRLFRDLTIVLGLLAILTALLGLIGMYFGITLISSVYAGYRTMAMSAVLIWTIIGFVLVIHAAKPLRGTAALVARLVLAAIIIVEAIELPLNILGTHSLFELWLTEAGRTIIGPSSAPMSPVASVFIILAALSLFFILQDSGGIRKNALIADAAGITGLCIAVVSFTFVLSYAIRRSPPVRDPVYPDCSDVRPCCLLYRGGTDDNRRACGGSPEIPDRKFHTGPASPPFCTPRGGNNPRPAGPVLHADFLLILSMMQS